MKTKPRVTLVNLAQLDWIRRSERVGLPESDKRVTREWQTWNKNGTN